MASASSRPLRATGAGAAAFALADDCSVELADGCAGELAGGCAAGFPNGCAGAALLVESVETLRMTANKIDMTNASSCPMFPDRMPFTLKPITLRRKLQLFSQT